MPSKWFERAFNFDLPLEMYPNAMERLRGAPARMEERLRDAPDEILSRRDGDNWSIKEHAGHLYELELLWLGRLDDYEAGRERLRPADLENRATWEGNYNARPIGEILQSFRAARREFVKRLEQAGEDFASHSALHPRLNQPMRVIDGVFFTCEHDDHHLAHITRLLRRFGASQHL
jgi:uncharacterized damage-inducible protein DinB